MKRKALIFIVTLLSVALFAQNRSDYIDYSFSTHEGPLAGCYSTSYFDGKTWLFINSLDINYFTTLNVSNNGHIGDISSLSYIDPEGVVIKNNSVVFNQKLYLFYFTKYSDSQRNGELRYSRIEVNHQQHNFIASELNLEANFARKMSAIATKDTLYLFFVEKNNGNIQYLKGVAKSNSDEIKWVSTTPTTMLDSTSQPLISHGNVAACIYHTPENDERILVAFPGEPESGGQNYINYYSGSGDNFEFHHKKSCSGDYTAFNVSLMQGSVKGGQTKKYMMQTAYTTKGYDISKSENTRMFRNEFDLITGDDYGWEEFAQWDEYVSMAPEFMEFFAPDGNTKEIRKYMYLLYNGTGYPSANVCQWESDLLKLIGSVTEIAPKSFMEDLWELTAVIEGPPPFVLNGHTIRELWNDDHYPPSSFIYGKTQVNTVTSSTTYTKTVEASGGFGPINGGFKRAMQHGSSQTDQTSISVKSTILPPLADEDSCGLLWSYYIAPSLERSRWRLHDYNGDTLSNCQHSLFLFNFIQPQLKPIKESFTLFANSPRLDSLESYEGRNVEGFLGLEVLIETELLEDIGGGNTEEQSIEFDSIKTTLREETRSVHLGIDVELSIFSFSAGYEVELEFSSEHTTEIRNNFDLTYNNPAPKVWHDTSNILSYNTLAYVMKTTSSEAYFLNEGFKHARPLFVTWGVNSIKKGEFLESVEDMAFVKKYQFNFYPNPCSSYGKFQFTLADNSTTTLILYNSRGEKISELLNLKNLRGKQTVDISTTELANGLYYYKLIINSDIISGAIMIVH